MLQPCLAGHSIKQNNCLTEVFDEIAEKPKKPTRRCYSTIFQSKALGQIGLDKATNMPWAVQYSMPTTLTVPPGCMTHAMLLPRKNLAQGLIRLPCGIDLVIGG